MSSQRIALLIGAARFPAERALDTLVGPSNDIRRLQEVLAPQDLGSFQVELLEDRPHYEITRRINAACRTTGLGDFLFIYYSGHGKLDAAGRLYLATLDTEVAALESTSVALQHLRNMIEISNCGKIIVALDCCYSGSVDRSFNLRGAVADQLGQMAEGRGIFIMTASTGVQTARESREEQVGVFTKYLVEGIRTGDPDTAGKGYITADDLFTYVHRKVIVTSHQEPMKWDFGVRGELIIARTAAGPAHQTREKIRTRVLELAQEGVLPDGVVVGVFDFLSRLRGNPHLSREPQFAILQRLVRYEITVGQFVEDWVGRGRAEPPDASPPSSDSRTPNATFGSNSSSGAKIHGSEPDRKLPPNDSMAPFTSVADHAGATLAKHWGYLARWLFVVGWALGTFSKWLPISENISSPSINFVIGKRHPEQSSSAILVLVFSIVIGALLWRIAQRAGSRDQARVILILLFLMTLVVLLVFVFGIA